MDPNLRHTAVETRRCSTRRLEAKWGGPRTAQRLPVFGKIRLSYFARAPGLPPDVISLAQVASTNFTTLSGMGT